MEFVHTLRSSAFDGLSIEDHTEDLHGWMDGSFAAVITRKLQALDRHAPLLVVEVGSWKGLSCTTMADTIKHMGFTDFNIICVDTWLGAPEFWTWGLHDPSRGGSLNRINGFPSVFTTFAKNIKLRGHHDVVAPFPLSSQQALEVLMHYNIEADLIYVDASHEYQAVKDDIAGWWKILKKHGTLMGDDYMPGWSGVVRAVNEKGTPELDGVVWSFTKNT